MTKIFSLLFLLLMLIQVIRPLGLPGLRKRADCWKLAVLAFVVFGGIIFLRP